MALSWFSKVRPTVINQEKVPCKQFSIKEPMIVARSPSEDEIFNKFKKQVSDLEQEDVVLLRFLKARDFQIPQAEVMLRNMLTWRIDNKIDDLKNWEPPSHFLEDMPFKVLDNCDYNGVPMAWIPVGRWKARKWVDSNPDKSEITRYGYYVFESLYQILKKHHRKQFGVIIDCEHLSYHEATHIESLQTLFTCCKALEQNYPETMNKVFIINAPWVFSIVFNFVKCIVSKHTLAKITLQGHNKNEWMKGLLEYAPQEALPKEYFEDENAN